MGTALETTKRNKPPDRVPADSRYRLCDHPETEEHGLSGPSIRASPELRTIFPQRGKERAVFSLHPEGWLFRTFLFFPYVSVRMPRSGPSVVALCRNGQRSEAALHR